VCVFVCVCVCVFVCVCLCVCLCACAKNMYFTFNVIGHIHKMNVRVFSSTMWTLNPFCLFNMWRERERERGGEREGGREREGEGGMVSSLTNEL